MALVQLRIQEGEFDSTLLKLILGENQQAYANDLWIWGRKKGSDLSVWDIWKHKGHRDLYHAMQG
jgi:molybdate transport system ATP-binding protein